jgi:FAD/FMN-containing dehydrogenase
VSRVAPDATAFPHREVKFVVNVHTRWGEASQDQACIAWARQFFDRMAPHATGGVYVNFMPEDEAERVGRGAYGDNHARLVRLKEKYDPGNLFRQNQNIRPAAAPGRVA